MMFKFRTLLLLKLILIIFSKVNHSLTPSNNLIHSNFTNDTSKKVTSAEIFNQIDPAQKTLSNSIQTNISAPFKNKLSIRSNGSSFTNHSNENYLVKNSLLPSFNKNTLKKIDPQPQKILVESLALRTENQKPKSWGSSKPSHSSSPKSNSKGKTVTKTSTRQKNSKGGVIAAFVIGWILFFVSICFICWNERKAVKDTEVLDYLADFCYDGTNGTVTTNQKNQNFNLICGTASVEKSAEIPNLPTLFSNKTVLIFISAKKFNGIEEIIEKDDNGEEVSREEKENWVNDSEVEKVLNPTYKGEVIVNENNIKFDINLLNANRVNYHFESNKLAIFESFVKSQGWIYNSDTYCLA